MRGGCNFGVIHALNIGEHNHCTKFGRQSVETVLDGMFNFVGFCFLGRRHAGVRHPLGGFHLLTIAGLRFERRGRAALLAAQLIVAGIGHSAKDPCLERAAPKRGYAFESGDESLLCGILRHIFIAEDAQSGVEDHVLIMKDQGVESVQIAFLCGVDECVFVHITIVTVLSIMQTFMYKGGAIYYNLFMRMGRPYFGLLIFILAYPAAHFIVQYVPNPFVPDANLAINMIFPVVAGYLYGPVSGALAGLLGTGFSAVLMPDLYDLLAILPHTLMGTAAGIVGKSRQQLISALCILIGHALNILFFWRFGMLEIKSPFILALGLTTETTIDVVVIIFLIVLLQKRVYRENEQRW